MLSGKTQFVLEVKFECIVSFLLPTVILSRCGTSWCTACGSDPRQDAWDYVPGMCPGCDGTDCSNGHFLVCTCFTHHMRESLSLAQTCRYARELYAVDPVSCDNEARQRVATSMKHAEHVSPS